MRTLFKGSPRVTQTTKLKAWLAVPGNKNKTAAEYARALKDKTVIQGEMK